MFDGLDNTHLGVATAVVVVAVPLFRLFYTFLLPRPISGVPHSPVSSIWGDIPRTTMATAAKTLSEYLADEAHKHGPIFQVGATVHSTHECANNKFCFRGLKMFLAWYKTVIITDHAEVERLLVHGKSTEQSSRAMKMFVLFEYNFGLGISLFGL